MGAASIKEQRWTVFLSYSSEDKPFADWLYHKLTNANLSVWYDTYEILVGDSITARIAEGLKESDIVIVVLSRGVVKSNWIMAEMQQIEKQKLNVLPLVLDNINPEEISNFFKGKKWLPFPRQDSDEAFDVLLKSIKGYLEQKNSLGLRSNIEPERSVVPFGLLGSIEPERFIVPELVVRRVTEDIIKKQSVSIIGARRMGKTSLLRFLGSPQCQDYYWDESSSIPKLRFVYLDLQAYGGKNRDELLLELVDAMSEFLPANERFEGHTYREALAWIKLTVGRRNAGSSLWILLFDDFDQVINLDGADQIFFDELCSLSQYYNLCYVIASHRKLLDLSLFSHVGTSPFFNLFNEQFLAVWDEHTARQLMFKPRGENLDLFTDDDFAFMMRLTARHPFLLQLGCYHLFLVCQKGQKMVRDYDRLLDAYMLEAGDFYRYYWRYEINDVEREWLSDCWQALSRKSQNAQEILRNLSLGQKNRNIRANLARLGFVLSESGPIEIPAGFKVFLERR